RVELHARRLPGTQEMAQLPRSRVTRPPADRGRSARLHQTRPPHRRAPRPASATRCPLRRDDEGNLSTLTSMAIPTYDEITLPLLRILSDGKEYQRKELPPLVADHFKLTEEERNLKLPSGQSTYIKNRTGW